ncbi:MAG: VOC family protein [Faecalicatena sp.]|uniref:VOC family protein n=1 Tax=Faecalicatena sp. TaxID=2005360 RepID=UPI00258825AF|nr:VOC family protein [Faecalicatena sp.]MCI6465684.1 VOC family protein [Faecalicatena sp.]MDY5618041.1 VOC family protein [Lachnospiraceae bacterium]
MEQKYGRVLHLGIIVADLKKAVEIYENEMGITPWEISEHAPFFADKKVNDGIGMDFAAAMFRKDGYEIELIQPVGPSVYMDWLNEHGPGIHHVVLDSTESYKETLAMAERVSGRKPYLDVRFPDGTPIVFYADMIKETGLLLEVGNTDLQQ